MPNILIVDDDPTIRMMYGRALKALGDVDLAPSGTEALRMFAAKKYHVILLDLHMPAVDGFDLLETLADKQTQNHDTPVFVVTADTSDQARVRAARKHAVFLLTKPVPIASLVSLVDSALKKALARSQGSDSDPAPRTPKKG